MDEKFMLDEEIKLAKEKKYKAFNEGHVYNNNRERIPYVT
jgi:hypothetical protein